MPFMNVEPNRLRFFKHSTLLISIVGFIICTLLYYYINILVYSHTYNKPNTLPSCLVFIPNFFLIVLHIYIHHLTHSISLSLYVCYILSIYSDLAERNTESRLDDLSYYRKSSVLDQLSHAQRRLSYITKTQSSDALLETLKTALNQPYTFTDEGKDKNAKRRPPQGHDKPLSSLSTGGGSGSGGSGGNSSSSGTSPETQAPVHVHQYLERLQHALEAVLCALGPLPQEVELKKQKEKVHGGSRPVTSGGPSQGDADPLTLPPSVTSTHLTTHSYGYNTSINGSISNSSISNGSGSLSKHSSVRESKTPSPSLTSDGQPTMTPPPSTQTRTAPTSPTHSSSISHSGSASTTPSNSVSLPQSSYGSIYALAYATSSSSSTTSPYFPQSLSPSLSIASDVEELRRETSNLGLPLWKAADLIVAATNKMKLVAEEAVIASLTEPEDPSTGVAGTGTSSTNPNSTNITNNNTTSTLGNGGMNASTQLGGSNMSSSTPLAPSTLTPTLTSSASTSSTSSSSNTQDRPSSASSQGKDSVSHSTPSSANPRTKGAGKGGSRGASADRERDKDKEKANQSSSSSSSSAVLPSPSTSGASSTDSTSSTPDLFSLDAILGQGSSTSPPSTASGVPVTNGTHGYNGYGSGLGGNKGMNIPLVGNTLPTPWFRQVLEDNGVLGSEPLDAAEKHIVYTLQVTPPERLTPQRTETIKVWLIVPLSIYYTLILTIALTYCLSRNPLHTTFPPTPYHLLSFFIISSLLLYTPLVYCPCCPRFAPMLPDKEVISSRCQGRISSV